jgi:predicted nucleic acid-binding protein
MTRYLLDTNLVSKYFVDRDAEVRHPTLSTRVKDILASERPHVSIVTTYELLRGARRMELKGQGQQKDEKIRKLIKNLRIVEVGWGFAADLWAQTQVNGVPMGEADLFIVASAAMAQRVVATADEKLVNALVALRLEQHVEWWPLER